MLGTGDRRSGGAEAAATVSPAHKTGQRTCVPFSLPGLSKGHLAGIFAMPKENTHHPKPYYPSLGSLKNTIHDRLTRIRLRLWRHANATPTKEAQAGSSRLRRLASLKHKLASTVSSSYRFVATRLATLKHIRFPAKRPRFWIPSQLVRWDLLGVSMSYLWGKVNAAPLPHWARAPLYKTWGYAFKANLAEAKQPLHEYPTLKAFFTRELKDGVRPIDPTGMASPCDSKIITFGEVTSERVEHVKGITYPVSGFLGSDIHALKKNPKNRLYHCVLYLAPGDYHRIHSPVTWDVETRRHFPGTLFPVAPAVTRLIPNLLALNERVVLNGQWEHGFFSLSPVGAYNVGSIVINFDPEVKTNVITRDFRCPNLRYFSFGGVGTYAYEKQYEQPIPLAKGQELGAFNLGSTVVLFFEAPDFRWTVKIGDKLKMGQKIGEVLSTEGLLLPLSPRVKEVQIHGAEDGDEIVQEAEEEEDIEAQAEGEREAEQEEDEADDAYD